ncbi:hypothetical protein [Pseudomonas sp. GL-RE-19]|uniref:hypothetical protein n=1 Tax=Pseudomonas sp. GL-RE-19 TaxID=2832389 RepID=UPI001CC11F51|nr:hypothetical protein [Pseudomonas sp. GL-RE-19]
MSKKPNVFGQAALAAYKKRHARTGEIEWFSDGSPLIDAAKDDPDSLAMDADWLTKTLASIPASKQVSLGEVVRVAVRGMPGGDTEANRTIALYRLLKGAEAKGHLANFQRESTTPAPRRMTEAEVDTTADYLKHHHVISEDFKNE